MSDNWERIFKLLVAIALLVSYFILLRKMWGLVDTQAEIYWTRAAYLWGGVESLVFAATGFLFGREVHREKAVQAEKRAENSESKAAEEKDRANKLEVKGQALATALRAAARSKSSNFVESRKTDEIVPTEVDEWLLQLADNYFPSPR